MSSRAGVTVGEDEDVTSIWKTRFDPAALMLEVEFFIVGSSMVVGLGVAPAIEQISTVSAVATSVTSSLLGGRAVVNDPDLVEVMGANENLVELGVVIHGVDIGPARAPILVEVDVGEFRMLADNTIVVFAGVEILYEVVPDMPFPDNVTTGWPGLVNLEEHIRVELAADGTRVASCLDGLSA